MLITRSYRTSPRSTWVRAFPHRSLNRILHTCDVDLVTSGPVAVHSDIQVGMTKYPKNPKILNPLDPTHDPDDLVGFFLQDLQVIAVHLGSQLLDPTDRLFHVSSMGREKTQTTPGILLSSLFMAAINSSLFW